MMSAYCVTFADGRRLVVPSAENEEAAKDLVQRVVLGAEIAEVKKAI